MRFRTLVEDRLWMVEHSLRFYGVELGRRMTVVRLSGGGLWLHSPARPTPEVRAWLDGLGPVAHVVSPSLWHHFWIEEYAPAFPSARVWASPGLPRKRPDVPFDERLGEEPPEAWSDEIDQLVFRGNRMSPAEIEFLHRPTRTLIVTDVLFHITAAWPLATRIVGRFLGVYGKLGSTRTFRLATYDREAARRSAKRILAWDFDRVIVAHGEIVETGGKRAVEEAFAWLF